MAGTLLRRFCDSRGARISWLIVGIRRFFALRPWDRSLPTAAAHATTRRSSRKRNRTKPLLQRFGARAARGPHPLGRGRGAQLGVSSVAAFWRPVHRSLGRPWNIGWPTACPESEVGITHPAVIVKHCLEKTRVCRRIGIGAKRTTTSRKIQSKRRMCFVLRSTREVQTIRRTIQLQVLRRSRNNTSARCIISWSGISVAEPKRATRSS